MGKTAQRLTGWTGRSFTNPVPPKSEKRSPEPPKDFNELDEAIERHLKNFVPQRYLTQSQAVKYTGTSHTTIRKWVTLGLKQIIFDDDSRPKYDIQDIDSFIAKHKI